MKIRGLPIRKLRAPRERGEGIVLSYTASTAAVDRYGDIISQKGWELDSFRENPVVLWQHRSDMAPIGKGSVKVHNDSLLIDVEFDTDDFSSEIARKAEAGFINAVSVGFNPIKSTPRSDLAQDHFAYGEKGMYFESAELLEVSMVSIPANGDAVAAKAYDLPSMIAAVSKHILEIRDEEDRIVIHFAKSEREETIEEEPEEEIIEESTDPRYTDAAKEEEEEETEKFFTPAERFEWDAADKEFINELIKLGEESPAGWL